MTKGQLTREWYEAIRKRRQEIGFSWGTWADAWEESVTSHFLEVFNVPEARDPEPNEG